MLRLKTMSESMHLIEEYLIKFRLEMRNSLLHDCLDSDSRKWMRKQLDLLLEEFREEIEGLLEDLFKEGAKRSAEDYLEALRHIEELYSDLPQLYMSLRAECKEQQVEKWNYWLEKSGIEEKGE